MESLQEDVFEYPTPVARYATRAYLDWNEISIMQMHGCMECVTVREAELSIRSLAASRATHSFI